MARYRIKVPPAGQSVELIVILEWHVEPGAPVAEGSDLVTVEAEKVDLVIPCPISGTLVEVLAGPGDELLIGDPLCVIESEG